MRSSPRILLKLVKNCGFLFSNLNTFLKSYVVGSSHYIFFFRLLWVPYIDTNPFLHVLEQSVISDLNFASSTQCDSNISDRLVLLQITSLQITQFLILLLQISQLRLFLFRSHHSNQIGSHPLTSPFHQNIQKIYWCHISRLHCTFCLHMPDPWHYLLHCAVVPNFFQWVIQIE